MCEITKHNFADGKYGCRENQTLLNLSESLQHSSMFFLRADGI